MPTPHVTTARRVGRKPPVPAVPDFGKSKVGIISELAARSAHEPGLDLETRRMMIAEAAYYCAEKRGFAPGSELEDWLEAEFQIQARLGI